MENLEEFLEHYGIKGMKWGIRRSDKELARARSSSKNSSLKDLSDSDLQSAVNRLRMESEFNRLSKELYGSGSKGSSRTKKLLKSVGDRQIDRVAQAAGTVAVNQALRKASGQSNPKAVRELADVTIGKKKKK